MDVEAISQNEDKQKKIFSILFKQDEITWKSLIMDLINTEEMNPWDIDLSKLAEEFLETLKAMKEFDFRISGKIILAASFFLKIKSDRLLNEDLQLFDDLLSPQEEENFLEMMDQIDMPDELKEKPKPTLKHKTPKPRKRKVSVYDLIDALENALESGVKKSLKNNKNHKKIKAPEKQKDITQVINELYDEIQKTLKKVSKVQFSQLLTNENKEAKINTFIPLLYLDTQRKVDLEQEKHFGDINVKLTKIKKDYATN